MFIKAGSIQNLTDARYFTSRGVEMIGFCFDKTSGRFIQPADAQEIMKWLQGPKIIAEFGNQQDNEIREISMVLNPDFVQAPPEVIEVNRWPDIPTRIVEIILTEEVSYDKLVNLSDQYGGIVDYFLLDFKKAFPDWNAFTKDAMLSEQQLQLFCASNAVILDMCFNQENILTIIDSIQPAGINLYGGKEKEIGSKSFQLLDELFETLENKL